MTRQEILSWADEAWATSTEREGESLVVRLVRATLEEAARAVCPDCALTLAEQENVAFYWVHTDRSADPWSSKVCSAAPIHDLIAALDSEDV